MRRRRITVTIDEELLRDVDRRVAAGEFSSRSRAVRAALLRILHDPPLGGSLLRELANLDSGEERALAEEWLAGETISRRGG
jgi:Arc/MetJ-type ribon-helix-helix transcriptional regulator